MSGFVVDTNVPVVANGKSQQADPDCVIACLDVLTEIHDGGTIFLDDALLILHEYMKHLNLSGQPGPGDAFMQWVWDVQADERHCRQIHITPREDDPYNFVEFPLDARLAHFDPSDRKFVAVALGSHAQPKILNAVDSDWANHHPALIEAGVHIQFLCPQHVYPG